MGNAEKLMGGALRQEELECDLCVIGGGLSGTFAAIAAARRGTSVVLIQDRPMLGGNASSEIRMWVRGARGFCNKESGLLLELEERNIHGNPTLVHSLQDATLYGMVAAEPNIRLLLNTSCCGAETEGDRILSVTAWQSTTYTWHRVRARIFADCSGDSILAPLTGAEYRHGRESKAEYGEALCPDVADGCTMGMSVILAARETDHPVSFTPPSFASVYPTDECFAAEVGENVHAQIRDHRIGTSGANLWWVELGGTGNTIFDADRVGRQLLANIYGVWDHIKNRGDHGMENWDLEWVGFLPGKRESRRYVGDVVVTEQDVLSGGRFEDEIAYGGWPLDDHNPYGMEKDPCGSIPSQMIPVEEPYGLPYRALYSKNVSNLMFAGRNISVTHSALSSTRVMGTCSLLGQAMGCGAALAIRLGCLPRRIYPDHIRELQAQLMEDGVFLPHFRREVSAQTRSASVNLSEEELGVLWNGVERPRSFYGENAIVQRVGEELVFRFESRQRLGALRLCFDPDYSRESITPNKKMRVFAMKLHTGKDFVPVKTAATIVKAFTVTADGEEIARVEDNFLSLVRIPLEREVQELRVRWLETHGAEEVRLFAADLVD